MRSKKIKKIIAIAIVSTMVSTGVPVTASAVWLKDSQNNWNWIENGNKATGWKQVDGNWYYFDANGKMQTGWVQTADSKWYYMSLDGAMKIGWLQDTDEKWYFTDASGVMQTGVIEVQGKVYVLQPSGAMATGSIVIEGETYTTDASGAITGDKRLTPNNVFTNQGTVTQTNSASNAETGTNSNTTTGTTSSTTNSSSSSSSSSPSHHHSSSSSSLSIINAPIIAGVIAPVAGATPVSTIAETTECTATIAWSENPVTFAEGTAYTATITITPKSGYTLSGVAANFFTVAGATATNAVNSGVVTAVFPATTVTVSSVDDIADISVANGTIQENIALPTTVGVILSDGTTLTKAVSNWTSDYYDGTTEGTYIFTGDVEDTITKARVNVIVEKAGTTPAAVTVSTVDDIADINVANGTTQENIGLPTTVGVTLSDGTTLTKAVSNWISDNYDGTIEDTYIFTGDVADTTTKAAVNVVVAAKPLLAVINSGNAILQNYIDVGITGVTASNLADINTAVKTARSNKASNLIQTEIQNVVDVSNVKSSFDNTNATFLNGNADAAHIKFDLVNTGTLNGVAMTITESTNSGVSYNGTVTRPEYNPQSTANEDDFTGDVTVTFTKGDITDTKDVSVTVLARTPELIASCDLGTANFAGGSTTYKYTHILINDDQGTPINGFQILNKFTLGTISNLTGDLYGKNIYLDGSGFDILRIDEGLLTGQKGTFDLPIKDSDGRTIVVTFTMTQN